MPVVVDYLVFIPARQRVCFVVRLHGYAVSVSLPSLAGPRRAQGPQRVVDRSVINELNGPTGAWILPADFLDRSETHSTGWSPPPAKRNLRHSEKLSGRLSKPIKDNNR